MKQTKGLKEEISWTDFVASWTKAAGIQRAQTELLQEFLVSQNKVTIQSFNQAVLWFGHFFVEGEAKKALEEARNKPSYCVNPVVIITHTSPHSVTGRQVNESTMVL